MNEPSSRIKLNRLQDIGLTRAHLDTCHIKLDKLQDVGLPCTHFNSCCMVSAIYSKIKLEKFQANNTTISQDHGYMKMLLNI